MTSTLNLATVRHGASACTAVLALVLGAVPSAPAVAAPIRIIVEAPPVMQSNELAPIPAQATGTGQQTSPNRNSGAPGGGPKMRAYLHFNPSSTDRISDAIGGAVRTCGPDYLEPRYRIDCIRVYFLQLSRELPRTGDYAPVRAALAKAAADLDVIVRQNRDPSAPLLRPRLNGKPAAPLLPPIRAVRPEAAARALRQAEAVIEETATVLLRSTENSERRTAHYQQIAAAIGSTKVLLRST